MALEDAWVVAESLGRLGLTEGLPAYQAARAQRCAKIVQAANSNARAYHLRGPLRGLAHAGLKLGGSLAPGLALRKFDWIYDHDVTAVPAAR
jgi:salicylate hydroxylase